MHWPISLYLMHYVFTVRLTSEGRAPDQPENTHTHTRWFLWFTGLSTGVMFFILYKLYVLLPSLTHAHTLTHSLTHTHARTHTHTHTHSLSHTHTLTLSYTHTHTHTHSLSLSYTHTNERWSFLDS